MKVVWRCSLVFVPVGFLAILAATPMGPGGSVFVMFAGLILIGIIAITAWEGLKRIPALQVSAEATEVWIFKDPAGDAMTEVIAASGEVFSIDGQRNRKLTYLEVIAPALPSPTVAGPGERRPLTAEEKIDVQRRITAVRQEAGKLLWLPGFSVFLGILFLLASTSIPGRAIGLCFLVSSVPSVWKGVKTRASAKRIERDLKEGTIQGLDGREILPHSQLDWSTNGFPAAWRYSPLLD